MTELDLAWNDAKGLEYLGAGEWKNADGRYFDEEQCNDLYSEFGHAYLSGRRATEAIWEGINAGEPE